MELKIRLALPTDALDMAEVLMRSWEVAYKDILPTEYIREKNASRPKQYKRFITDENKDSYVIQKGGKTIGIMKIAPPLDDDLDDNYYELHYIYLHPDYFRQGIGMWAVEFIVAKALALGKSFISVWVLGENVNSIKFYEKCGFKAESKTEITNRGK